MEFGAIGYILNGNHLTVILAKFGSYWIRSIRQYIF